MTRLVLFLMLFCGPALARDDGRYANSPLKQWFDLLASRKGLCCSVADGYVVDDPDWESNSGHFRVRIEDEWVDVPDDAVVTVPNKFGRTRRKLTATPPIECSVVSPSPTPLIFFS